MRLQVSGLCRTRDGNKSITRKAIFVGEKEVDTVITSELFGIYFFGVSTIGFSL